ncbi:MAG: patatin-like phospholipase family protein [Candidatus Woesearchaeota archaeon]
MKVSIIAEGGAMRGAYVAGALKALYEYHGLKSVDVATGSSAGIADLAYYLTGQIHDAYKVWTKYLTKPIFLSVKHAINHFPIVDIDYLVDIVFKKKVILNTRKLKKLKTKFIIPLTNANTGKTEYFTNKTNFDFFKVLKAALAVPFFYGKKVRVGKKEYYDGGVSDPLPLNIPELKNTRKIIILTHPKKERALFMIACSLLGTIKRICIPLFGESLCKKIKESDKLHLKQEKQIERLEKQQNVIIRPKKELLRLNNSSKNIRQSIDEGYNDTVNNNKLIELIKELNKNRPELFC